MAIDADTREALEGLIDSGHIAEILFEVRSGKEATVFCGYGAGRLAGRLLAVKVYRPIERRSFRNDAVYQGGRKQFARNSRVRRALKNRSSFGKSAQSALWVMDEWETARHLQRP